VSREPQPKDARLREPLQGQWRFGGFRLGSALHLELLPQNVSYLVIHQSRDLNFHLAGSSAQAAFIAAPGFFGHLPLDRKPRVDHAISVNEAILSLLSRYRRIGSLS